MIKDSRLNRYLLIRAICRYKWFNAIIYMILIGMRLYDNYFDGISYIKEIYNVLFLFIISVFTILSILLGIESEKEELKAVYKIFTVKVKYILNDLFIYEFDSQEQKYFYNVDEISGLYKMKDFISINSNLIYFESTDKSISFIDLNECFGGIKSKYDVLGHLRKGIYSNGQENRK